jgi:hypothetical protein
MSFQSAAPDEAEFPEGNEEGAPQLTDEQDKIVQRVWVAGGEVAQESSEVVNEVKEFAKLINKLNKENAELLRQITDARASAGSISTKLTGQLIRNQSLMTEFLRRLDIAVSNLSTTITLNFKRVSAAAAAVKAFANIQTPYEPGNFRNLETKLAGFDPPRPHRP